MEVEAVTHALRWIASRDDSQTTHAIILADQGASYKRERVELGIPNWNVSMVDINLRKLLYCTAQDMARREAWKEKALGGLP